MMDAESRRRPHGEVRGGYFAALERIHSSRPMLDEWLTAATCHLLWLNFVASASGQQQLSVTLPAWHSCPRCGRSPRLKTGDITSTRLSPSTGPNRVQGR